ncbi:hypothetical protein J416_05058 [Gracilibacillus halophilus YIM-C55.5]|uniref:Type IV pilus assembly PilZ n=1 Tax=Gracilibacillus halophilus YIM-C55.5 TaxID=1308866 RepID=N4WW95_9BACI|nr:PilZ domain-containing protein [Gracilibacillus halophilus]ENH97356.1 hypothetical protein J416_05058 [Gracilibacillus halophilus YIM-C55.5]
MIKIGTILHLDTMVNDQWQETYRCKVVETKDGNIYVDYPVNEKTNKTEDFQVGQVFRVHFIGQDTSVYSFNTRVTEKTKMTIPTLALDFSFQELKKIQRREFVRVPAMLDVSIRSVDQSFSAFTSVTHDISGGGLSVLIDHGINLQHDTQLDIMLVLPLKAQIEYIQMTGKVVRQQNRDREQSDLLSVKFHQINQAEQQLLIKYCYQYQLRERQKGLN